jgi:hypothetical protein
MPTYAVAAEQRSQAAAQQTTMKIGGSPQRKDFRFFGFSTWQW